MDISKSASWSLDQKPLPIPYYNFQLQPASQSRLNCFVVIVYLKPSGDIITLKFCSLITKCINGSRSRQASPHTVLIMLNMPFHVIGLSFARGQDSRLFFNATRLDTVVETPHSGSLLSRSRCRSPPRLSTITRNTKKSCIKTSPVCT